MNTQCLITKNPGTAELLRDYTNILGDENAAYWVISNNNGYGLDKDSNGKPSLEYQRVLNQTNNDSTAIVQMVNDFSAQSNKGYLNLVESNTTIHDPFEADIKIDELTNDIENLNLKHKACLLALGQNGRIMDGDEKANQYINENHFSDVAYSFRNKNNGEIYVKPISKKLLNEKIEKIQYEITKLTNFIAYSTYNEHKPSFFTKTDEQILSEYDETIRNKGVLEYEVTEEATGSDKTMVSRLFKNKNRVTIREMLSNIVKSDSVTKLLAKILLKADSNLLDNNYIYYVAKNTSEESKNTAGLNYDRSTDNCIIIFGDSNFKGKGAIADTTILHEIIHAATMNKLKSYYNAGLRLELKRIYNSAIAQLSKKYGLSRNELMETRPDIFYGLTDEYEFLAELFSNSRFAKELSSLKPLVSVKTEQINILQKLVKWILKVFNINNKDNLYSQASAELEKIIFNTELTLFDTVEYDSGYSYDISKNNNNKNMLERMSNFYKNKLQIKLKPFTTTKNKPLSKQDIIERLNDTFTDITGFNILQTYYNERIDNVNDFLDYAEFVLNNQLSESLKTNNNNTNELIYFDSYYNNVVSFLKSDNKLEEYSENDQRIFKTVFPTLFSDNNFKSEKQAKAFYLKQIQDKNSKEYKTLKSLIEQNNQQVFRDNKVKEKKETLSAFINSVPNWKKLIMNKMISEVRRLTSAAGTYQNEPNYKLKMLINDEIMQLDEDNHSSEWLYYTNAKLYEPSEEEKEISSTNAVEVLEKITKTTDSKFYKKLANYLLKYAKKHNYLIHLVTNLPEATEGRIPSGVTRMSHDEATKQFNFDIYLSANSNSFRNNPEHVILHELIHAFTAAAMREHPELCNFIKNYMTAVQNKLEKNQTRFLRSFKQYMFKDEFEFVAEVMSNPNVQEQLKLIPPLTTLDKIKSAFEHLFRKILSYLGVPTNSLEEIVPFMYQIIETQNSMNGHAEFAYKYQKQTNNFYYAQTSNETEIKKRLTNNSRNIVFNQDDHTYTNKTTGELYTPVSTVKELHGYGFNQSLISDETKAYGEVAAKAGTAIHDYIHSVLTGEPVQPSDITISDAAKSFLDKIIRTTILGKGETLLASEHMIANDSAKIAGTIDMLKVDKNGKIHLVDFKSKARVYKDQRKSGFDYYYNEAVDKKSNAAQHDYQLTMYERMLEMIGINVDTKEVIPLEYEINELGVITRIYLSISDVIEKKPITHRHNYELEQEINETVFNSTVIDAKEKANQENLLLQTKIVKNILSVLRNKLALLKIGGKQTRYEIVNDLVKRMNNMEGPELIVAYVNNALEQLHQVVEDYNQNLKLEQDGVKNVWSLRKLNYWRNFAESFENLNEVQNYILLNFKAFNLNEKDLNKLRESVATAISYKQMLEAAYKIKGKSLWLNWLTPFTSRVEADYRIKAEKEYKKQHKGESIDISEMNAFIEKYVEDHRIEINFNSRELLRQQSQLATYDNLSGIGRWLDTIYESNDTIVGAMARAYHTRWMEANEEFNEKYKTLVELTEELENAFPEFKNNPAKLYEFMIEDANDFKLVQQLPASFVNAYNNMKENLRNEPDMDKITLAYEISKWLNENAPIVGAKILRQEKQQVLQNLLDTGKITEKEFKVLSKNEEKDDKLKRTWKYLVDTNQISEDIADYLRVKFNQLNWSHRQPDPVKYKNVKYDKIRRIRESNPNDIRVRFFDFITELSKYGDSFVPERFKLNGRLPGVSKTMLERITTDSIYGTIKGVLSKEFQVKADDTEYGNNITDELGNPIKTVPIFFTNYLKRDDQSLDIATIYKTWFESVNQYKYINDILPQLEYTKFVIESRKSVKTDSNGNPVNSLISKISNRFGGNNANVHQNVLMTDENLINQVNNWFNQVVYGIQNKESVVVKGIDLNKVMKLFQSYTSLKVMGVNFISMTNNALMAELQQAIEAFAQQYVSKSSYTRGSKEYMNDLPNILGDIGARKITSLTNLLNEHFGVFTEFNAGSLLENNRLKRLAKTSTLFFTTNVGEHEAQSRFLLASLIEKRALDKDGNDIGSMYDYFSVENGRLVFDKEHKVANFSKKDQIAFGQQITAVLRKMHGNYANYSKVALQQYSLGKMALMFRKWIYTTTKRRFSKEYYDEYGQTYSKGYYRDGAAFCYNKVAEFFTRFSDESKALTYAENADWSTMTENEKANVKRFTTEVALFAAITAMSMLLSGFEPDDDDSTEAIVLNNLSYQLYRLSTDITFYILPSSFMKIVQSPIPSSSVIKNVSSFIDSCLDPMAKFEKGDWKGHYKIEKRAFDLLPIVRQLYRVRHIAEEQNMLQLI